MMNRGMWPLLVILMTNSGLVLGQPESDQPVRMAWKAELNHDGRFLAVGYGHWSEEGRVVVFDAKTLKERSRFSSLRGVRALLATPDKKQFVTGSVHGEYRVVDFESGKTLRRWEQTDGSVEGMCFSPDGKYLIAGSSSRRVYVYDFKSGEQVSWFEGFRDMVFSVAMSPDGEWLATSDRSGQIVILSFPAGKVRHRITHGNLIRRRAPSNNGLIWSKDGSKLFSGGFDETICVIDTNSGELIKQSEPFGTIDSLLKSADDRFLFTCDDTGLHRFDATSLKPAPFAPDNSTDSRIDPHSGSVPGLRWGSSEDQIVSASWDNQARIWDAKTGRCLKVFEPKNLPAERPKPPIAQRQLINNGIRYVTHNSKGTAIWAFTMNGERHILDPLTLETLKEPRKLTDSISQGTTTIDRSGVFLITFSRQLISVDPSNWQVNRVPQTGSSSAFWSVGQSSAGQFVVVGKENGRVAAIDIATSQLKWEVQLSDLPIACLSCSPDGKLVLATSGDYRKWREPGAAWLINSTYGSIVKQLKDHTAKVNLGGFLSDGRYFCTGSSDTRLLTYDLQNLDKKPVSLRLPSGPDRLCELNESVCAVSYHGGGLVICDPVAGTVVGRMSGHPRKESRATIIHSLSLSPGGKQLVSGDLAGDLFLWPVEEFTAPKSQ